MASALGMGLTFLSYIFIMTYGGMVLQGVQEEKKSRILEIMVSSVRPMDMMMGKIIGIGLAGVVQIIVWVVLLTLGSTGLQFFLGVNTSEATGAMSSGGATELIQGLRALSGINFTMIIVCFILFFIGGYPLLCLYPSSPECNGLLGRGQLAADAPDGTHHGLLYLCRTS